MKWIVSLLLICGVSVAALGDATRWNVEARPTSDWFSANDSPRNVPLQWIRDVDDLIQIAGVNPGRGEAIYVDSNVDNEGDGSDWDNAYDTLDEGINAADPNSIILVAQGHYEAMGAAADEVNIDVHGITVFGLGNGALRPTFDYTGDVTGAFAVGADGVTLYNLRFLANVADVNDAVEVEAGSEWCTIAGCVFSVNSAGTDEFHETINSNAAGNHYLRVLDCEFDMGAGAAVAAMLFRDCDYAQIVGNRFAGDYSTAVINNATTASDHILIQGNVITNGTIGGAAGLNTEPCIELKSDTSGVILNNVLVCNLATPDVAVVAADCWLIGNVYTETEGGVSVPPMWLTTDTALNIIGYDDNDNSYASTNVAANADGSIIERLEQIDTDTSAIVTDTAAMDTSDELEDLVDPNGVLQDAYRSTVGNYNFTDDTGAQAAYTIFTITGDVQGYMYGVCDDALTSGGAATIEVGVSGNTAVFIAQSTGTDLIANEIWHDATPTTTVEAVDMTAREFIVTNGQDAIFTIGAADLTAGDIDFYFIWKPLSSGASVVAP